MKTVVIVAILMPIPADDRRMLGQQACLGNNVFMPNARIMTLLSRYSPGHPWMRKDRVRLGDYEIEGTVQSANGAR